MRRAQIADGDDETGRAAPAERARGRENRAQVVGRHVRSRVRGRQGPGGQGGAAAVHGQDVRQKARDISRRANRMRKARGFHFVKSLLYGTSPGGHRASALGRSRRRHAERAALVHHHVHLPRGVHEKLRIRRRPIRRGVFAADDERLDPKVLAAELDERVDKHVHAHLVRTSEVKPRARPPPLVLRAAHGVEHARGHVAFAVRELHVVRHVAHLEEIALHLHVLRVEPPELPEHEPRLEHLVHEGLLLLRDRVVRLHPDPQVVRAELPELNQHRDRAPLALFEHLVLPLVESRADAILNLLRVGVRAVQKLLDVGVPLRALLEDLHPLGRGPGRVVVAGDVAVGAGLVRGRASHGEAAVGGEATGGGRA
mmetsp:Transcript_5923/g.23996  ORF Transcript_5923/g.23996 Transcript_5923/m.23996 type:complete len:370 (+) Transcript_5923:421-1530(+)